MLKMDDPGSADCYPNYIVLLVYDILVPIFRE